MAQTGHRWKRTVSDVADNVEAKVENSKTGGHVSKSDRVDIVD